VGVVPPGMSN
jgi:hypothetical protein